MTLRDLTALAPLIILTAAPVVIMLAAALRRSHRLAFGLAVGGVVLALLSLPAAMSSRAGRGAPLLSVDGYGLVFTALLLCAGLATMLLAYGYLAIRRGRREEFYILILTALLGATLLVNAAHLATLLLGLETLSVSLYALVAYERESDAGIEAGIKYLVLAAFSSAFLVFGMALVYAETGALSFSRIAVTMAGGGASPVLVAGGILISAGIGFKLALVPFHMWVADVYEGAPAPVTAFLSTVSKGAVFALLLRFFTPAEMLRGNAAGTFLAALAVASMIGGNLLALFQDNVKRLLAYSSVAQMGYLLVAFLAGGELRTRAVVFTLIAYFLASLGAFGVVTVLSESARDADRLEDYRGLFFRRPWLAGTFTAMLLSLAGIPLTAGFIGKFTILAAGVGDFLWVPVGVLVVTSVVGLFYYLRLLAVLYAPPSAAARLEVLPMPAGILTLAVVTALLLGLGIYPGPVLEAISSLGFMG